MTIITQANMDFAQDRLEAAIVRVDTVIAYAKSAADELCGQTGVPAETLAKLRRIEGKAHRAQGLLAEVMAETYDLSLPTATDPVAPNFGGNGK